MMIIIYYIITVHYSTQWHGNTKGKLQPVQEQEEQQLEPLLHQILHLYLTTWQAGIPKLQGQIIRHQYLSTQALNLIVDILVVSTVIGRTVIMSQTAQAQIRVKDSLTVIQRASRNLREMI